MYLSVCIFKNKGTVFAFTQKQLIYYLINRETDTHTHTHTPCQIFQAMILLGQQDYLLIYNCSLLSVSVKINNKESCIYSLMLKENYKA